jgi:hypothetical protein
MWETVLGGLVGGVFRIIPEIMKYLDRKNERNHELSMQDKALAFQTLKGDQRIDEIQAEGQREWNSGALDALTEAIKGQEAPSGVKWIDGWNKLIRPAMATQWVLILWPSVIVCQIVALFYSGTSIWQAIPLVFGEEEKAFTSAIANFYILNRVFMHVK